MNRLTRYLPGLAVASVLCVSGAFATGQPVAEQQAMPATPVSKLMAADAQGRYAYMIEFTEPELLRHPARADGPVDLQSREMQAARRALMDAQAQHIDTIAARLGRSIRPTHHYLATENGIAVGLSEAEARVVASLPGIKGIERAREYELQTYRGPEFIGANTIWNGSNVPGGSSLLGEEMVAAVLDSGIPDPAMHDSFANDAACGHGANGVPDKVISAVDCSSSDASGFCDGASPFDTDGHGSHTASTVAGNTVDSSSTPAANPPTGFTELSGVAPCAHIRSYRVCPGSTCPGPDIAAGLETVLNDGDAAVLNFSISGGASPWSDFDRIKLDLVDAGIFVAASAGNTGDNPDPVGRVNHRGPWVMSVAASTHDAIEGLPVSLDGGPSGAGIEGTGPALASTYVGPLRYAGDVEASNFEGCSAFAANAFDGEAALISRGSCSFADKVNNAVAAGANFVIVFNNVGGPPIVMGGLESTTVSSVMVDNTVGQALVSALAAGTAQVTVSTAAEGFTDPSYGDILAGFSLRGPTPSPLQDLQKPDITGPGVGILAAVPGGYARLSGTSMSSPHVAGAALLVRQAQPTWTVSEVKSALQMTSVKAGAKDDGTTPWDWDDVGSGRVDLTKAALAGLVMDETTANYLAADPATGGDVKALNVPSMRNLACSPQCSWQRTVRNTLGTSSSWTAAANSFNPNLSLAVSPTNFTFTGDPGETQTLTITATPQADLTGAINFGEVVLSEDGALAPESHLTVAMSGTDTLPPEMTITPASVSLPLNIDAQGSEVLTIDNSGDEALTWSIQFGSAAASRGAPDVIWDQPTESTGGIISDIFLGTSSGELAVYSANDFLAAPPQKIEQIFTPGFWNSADVSNADAITWYIYPDAGGKPAGEPGDGNNAEIWSYTAPPGSTGITIVDNNITLDVVAATGGPVDLPEMGRYWLVVAPNISVGDDLSNRWNWSQGASAEATSHLLDQDDLFGAGAIDWTPQTDLDIAWSDTAFTLSGTIDCSSVAPSWLQLDVESGTIPGAGSTQVTLGFDASGLTVGEYETYLCVTSNDTDNSLQFVPVTLTVFDANQIFKDRFESAVN